ncbi:acyl-CoA carboxylase subunit beta [Simiduia sp. 21SJ11W-1]|uniref:acyl-CoA carboxylase subunit beta n=1 Tax=Simiduia sp. 21SJ11W-1 TaxID=2909669 RepID=UPI00209C9C7F|nr:carboxyl transferase domain-containing protein [Simiduia sp. 21SJ11W-1]UTA46409.1 acyl-CoA carboxylase subunit beta [Simiduia sp. 21SJ11W-1]
MTRQPDAPNETARSADKSNRDHLLAQLAHIRAIEKTLADAAQAKREKYAARGMLLPRERLACLLDAGSPFIEVGALAGYKMYDDKDGTGAGGGCIGGIGFIHQTPCVIRVDNYAIKGGTISPVGMEKALRLQQIAMENKLPFVTLAQSGGANLMYANEIFAPGGRGFANQARMSAMGIPQVTVVHGSATAGGAYQPALSDYVVLVRNQATMYLAGPPLLKAATGEIATDEALGGTAVHGEQAGTGDYIAENDEHAIALARELVQNLNWFKISANTKNQQPALKPTQPNCILDIIPSNTKAPFDARDVIAHLTDNSHWLEFKAAFDQQTLCGQARIHGQPIGIITNNGPITSQGANKAAQFIQLCEQNHTPLLFLHNTTGFMVGTQAEQSGIIKHGAKMIQAVANAQVPKFSIVMGGSYGAGNYAMCGRGFDPRFIFAWPNSRTAVMGGAQAGKVLRIVTEAKMGSTDTAMLDKLEQDTAQFVDAQATALACTARLWDDGIIDPRHTRDLLGLLLAICSMGENFTTQRNSFGVARF